MYVGSLWGRDIYMHNLEMIVLVLICSFMPSLCVPSLRRSARRYVHIRLLGVDVQRRVDGQHGQAQVRGQCLLVRQRRATIGCCVCG